MKPLILITNDDGVHSPGLKAVAEAVAGLGELLVAAPLYQQTGMGRSFAHGEDVGIIRSFGSGVDTRYGIHGTPAQAVSYAVLEIASRKPDLCISGMNYGENIGRCVSCSGTLGAALEADSLGIPALAFSRQVPLHLQRGEDYADLSWDIHRQIVRRMTENVLQNGIGANTAVWNINLPDSVTAGTEIRLTRQSAENCFEFQKPAPRDRQKGCPLASRFQLTGNLHPEDDAYALYLDKVISATPLTWNMTAHTDKVIW